MGSVINSMIAGAKTLHSLRGAKRQVPEYADGFDKAVDIERGGLITKCLTPVLPESIAYDDKISQLVGMYSVKFEGDAFENANVGAYIVVTRSIWCSILFCLHFDYSWHLHLY